MPQHHRSNPGSGSGPARYPGTFLLAFREALAARKWQVGQSRGDLVACRDEHGQEHFVGLENLYRRARRVERSDWPALIAEFLNTVLDGEQPELPANLSTVADRLLLRLGPPMRVRPTDVRVWHKPLAGTGLGINLVVDSADRMCYVTEQMVTDSGQPGEVWLERALANLRARTPDDCLQVLDEPSDLRMCQVGDAYDTSRALLLDALFPEGESCGWLVALPGRDELLVIPVTAKSLPHLHLLKILAQTSFKTAPYPISDEIFWIHRGVWRLFPMVLDGQEVTIQPPPEFKPILETLAPPESEAGQGPISEESA
jgi:hypothetical protein